MQNTTISCNVSAKKIQKDLRFILFACITEMHEAI